MISILSVCLCFSEGSSGQKSHKKSVNPDWVRGGELSFPEPSASLRTEEMAFRGWGEKHKSFILGRGTFICQSSGSLLYEMKDVSDVYNYLGSPAWNFVETKFCSRFGAHGSHFWGFPIVKNITVYWSISFLRFTEYTFIIHSFRCFW